MKQFFSALFLIFFLTDGSSAQTNSALVVHEWGTFTSVAGQDGSAIEWRTLSDSNDLPAFVHQWNNMPRGLKGFEIKGGALAKIRMETPVIYFYTPLPMNVEVAVRFPEGTITEWFPHARGVEQSTIDWGGIRLMPGNPAPLPGDDSNSHYYAARATDAVPLRACGNSGFQYEKFLFYRGIGNFNPPVRIHVLANNRLQFSGALAGIDTIFLFENDDGKFTLSMVNPSGEDMQVFRPMEDVTVETVHVHIFNLLTRHGLYPKEAEAMIQTWKDSWFEEGARAFYVLPRSVTDEILPIQIEPAPVELTRVMVIRTEYITEEILEDVKRSGANASKYARFAEPIREILSTK